MKTINLKSIIEANGLDAGTVAEQLFPKNKFPVLALNRLLAGGGELDAMQISKLALMADCTIENLYGRKWKAASKESIHTFTSDDYVAHLDTDNWTVKIFHKKSLIHEHLILDRCITVSALLEKINQIIHENN